MTKPVTISLPADVREALMLRSVTERRSMSSMAAILLAQALGCQPVDRAVLRARKAVES